LHVLGLVELEHHFPCDCKLESNTTNRLAFGSSVSKLL
jgi:hypothetical protein